MTARDKFKNGNANIRKTVKSTLLGIVSFFFSVIVFLILFNTEKLITIFIDFYFEATWQQILSLIASGVIAGILGLRRFYLYKK